MAVQTIDGMSGVLVATIETTGFDSTFGDITTGGGYIWLSAPHNIPLAQIDPATNIFIRRFSSHAVLGGFIRFGAPSLWVSGFHIYRILPPSG